MKFLLISVTLVAFCKVETISQNTKNNALRKSFANISKVLAKQNHLVSIIVGDALAEEEKSGLFALTAATPHAVDRFGNESKKFQLNSYSSAIVLLDSVASLKAFRKRTILPSYLSTATQIFVHCRDGTFDKLVKIRPTRRNNQHEYFVIEEEQSIRLLTFVWYTPEKCLEAQLIEVNRFDKSTGRWQHGNFKIDKSANFYGCHFNVLFGMAAPDFWHQRSDIEGQRISKCTGYTCELVRDFSSVLNFKYHMYTHESIAEYPEDPTIEFEVICVDLSTKPVWDPNNKRLTSRPMYYREIFIASPPGELFNGYEKMTLPFDAYTWLCIEITFALAFAAIFVLRLVRPGIANFVIGKFVTTPALNVLRAFFGIAQIVCPGRNFARYLLMMFILFSLVIRTAYQGKMFEFLQKTMRKRPLATIDELIENNFTFFMYPGFRPAFKDSDLVRRGKVIDDWAYPELMAAYERAYTPGSKTAVFYQKILFAQIFQGTNRTEPPKLLEERYSTNYMAAVFKTQHAFFEVFDRKLQQYIEADLINYNIKNFVAIADPDKYKKHQNPFKHLTLGELEAGFVVCMVPLALTSVVFGIEWLPTLKDLMVFLFIFKWYFGVKKLEQSKHSKAMKIKMAFWQAAFRERVRRSEVTHNSRSKPHPQVVEFLAKI